MFIGREFELEQLEKFKNRKQAGLIVCSGRRRVGKSTLIEKFAEDKTFAEFYGLPPHKTSSVRDQLNNFSKLLSEQFSTPYIQFPDWHDALNMLASLSRKEPIILLLDEISWMASNDKNFAGILKSVWDTKFKKNSQLILILCGSVSSWIEENILRDKGFVGRVSLTIKLDELSLAEANHFWDSTHFISAYEKFKILSVTGGIPRYLEEIDPKLPAEENIKNLCFTNGAVLVEEFNTIFKDIFEKRATEYKEIVKVLLNKHLQAIEICEKLKTEQTGSFSKKLDDLEESGFITREFVWNMDARKTSTSKYRLRDNYLRFYLKYIEPKLPSINRNLYRELHLESLPDWHSTMGLQFENLVLNNLKSVLQILKISPESFISAAPYFQQRTKRSEACQIDLLIQTRYSYYVCEIKFKKSITKQIIPEMLTKMQKLKAPKTVSLRPVLIYVGNLAPGVVSEGFFTNLIDFSCLLEQA